MVFEFFLMTAEVAEGGLFLFVGRRRQTKRLPREEGGRPEGFLPRVVWIQK